MKGYLIFNLVFLRHKLLWFSFFKQSRTLVVFLYFKPASLLVKFGQRMSNNMYCKLIHPHLCKQHTLSQRRIRSHSFSCSGSWPVNLKDEKEGKGEGSNGKFKHFYTVFLDLKKQPKLKKLFFKLQLIIQPYSICFLC